MQFGLTPRELLQQVPELLDGKPGGLDDLEHRRRGNRIISGHYDGMDSVPQNDVPALPDDLKPCPLKCAHCPLKVDSGYAAHSLKRLPLHIASVSSARFLVVRAHIHGWRP